MNSLPEPIGKFDAFYYLIEHLSNLNVGLTVKEIADGIGKSEKQVRRYLDSMENTILGINLIKERGNDRYYRYRIEKNATPFRPLILNSYEVIALNFIRGFAHFKDFPVIQENLNMVFKKIATSANESRNKTGSNFQERVSKLFISPKQLGGKVYKNKNEFNILEKLIEAALDFKVCNVLYGTEESSKDYEIRPIHFFNYRDAIYLISLSKNSSVDEYRNFALHRIKEMDFVENKHFEYPEQFDIQEYFKSNVFNFEGDNYNIKLKFPPHSKEYILEREWFPNQKANVLKDGSVILEFDSDINMILIGWIRGFGPDVEVLEPEVLREKMIDDLETNLNQY